MSAEENDLLGRMHLDAVRNGDWEGAARLAEAIEAHRIPPVDGCGHCGCYGGHAHPTCPGEDES